MKNCFRAYYLAPLALLTGSMVAGSQIGFKDFQPAVNRTYQLAVQLERSISAFQRTLNRRVRGFDSVARESVRLQRATLRFGESLENSPGRRSRFSRGPSNPNRDFGELRHAFLSTERSLQAALAFRNRNRSHYAVGNAWSQVAYHFNLLQSSLEGSSRRNWRSPGPAPVHGLQESVVRCASHDYRYRQCHVPGWIVDVRLRDRHSRARCIPGRTFGFRGNGLWVDEGCDADFSITWTVR